MSLVARGSSLVARGWHSRGWFASLIVLLALPLLAVGPLPERAAASPVVPPQLDGETQSMVDAYLRTYPEMTIERALDNLSGQAARIRLLETIGARGDAGFGGSWFDARAGVEHLAITDDGLTATYADLAVTFGVEADVHMVTFPAEELREVSAAINSGLDPFLGVLGADQSSVDFEQNAVLVTVTPAVYESLGGAAFAAFHPAVRLVPGTPIVLQDDACNSRYACGAPLRGGVVLHLVGSSRNCSLGYTASATDGSRWAITAGHCGNQLNYKWRHGEVVIGPVRATYDEAEVDVARIRIDHSYWLQSGGGYLYDYYNPNTPARLTYSITNRTTIEVDEMVCLNAQYSTPTHTCGVITSTYGPRNMPSVDFDACPGDSGGALIFRPPGGTSRWAYGVHSGSSPDTCHALLGYSIFTAVPDMNIVFDEFADATIRIEVRR